MIKCKTNFTISSKERRAHFYSRGRGLRGKWTRSLRVDRTRYNDTVRRVGSGRVMHLEKPKVSVMPLNMLDVTVDRWSEKKWGKRASQAKIYREVSFSNGFPPYLRDGQTCPSYTLNCIFMPNGMKIIKYRKTNNNVNVSTKIWYIYPKMYAFF